MSDTLADLAALLPSDFLSDNNNLNLNKVGCFPYEFGSCSSTESESDDDDVTGLTRRFTRSVSLQERIHMSEKMRGYSGSPESTLNWCPTQVRSTPATPFGQRDEDSWDRIYAAAGQIAMLKMKMQMKMNQLREDDVLAHQILHGGRPPSMGPTMGATRAYGYDHHEELVMQLRFRRTVSGTGNFNRPLGFRQPAWPKHVSGYYGGGSHVVKKECAGTGVFLPRVYSPQPPEAKKTQASCSPGLMPARLMAQSYNNNIVDPKQPNGLFAQPNMNVQHGELLMARRNNNMVMQQLQQKQQGHVEQQLANEVVLPQEWTY